MKISNCTMMFKTLLLKIGLLCMVFIYPLNVSAQNRPYIAIEAVNECTIKGLIDDKYPITIYLKYESAADCVLGAYTVSGWYYYDKIRTQIPLSGFYYEDLVMYNFPESKQDTQLINYSMVRGYYPDTLLNLTGYKEKFLFANDSIPRGVWKSGKKQLSVKLDIDDLDVLEPQSFLLFNTGEYFNLTNHFWHFTKFKYLCSNNDNSKVILQYSRPTRSYACGRCGASTLEGIYVLYFDKQKELLDFDNHIIRSCWEGLSYTEGYSIVKNWRAYQVLESWNNDKKFELVVDLSNTNITIDSLNHR